MTDFSGLGYNPNAKVPGMQQSGDPILAQLNQEMNALNTNIYDFGNQQGAGNQSVIDPQTQSVFNQLDALMAQANQQMTQILQQPQPQTTPTVPAAPAVPDGVPQQPFNNQLPQAPAVTNNNGTMDAYDQVHVMQNDFNNYLTQIAQVPVAQGIDVNQKSLAVAKVLHEAMDGWGTDEEAIAQALESLTPQERVAVEKAYAQLYGEGDMSKLRKDLRSELGGSDEEKAFALLNQGTIMDPMMSAWALKEAMAGAGTDAKTVHAIMDGASNQQTIAIEQAFDALIGQPGQLRDWIKGDFSGAEEDGLINKINQAAIAPNN